MKAVMHMFGSHTGLAYVQKKGVLIHTCTIRIHVRVSHSVSPMISFAKEDCFNFDSNPANLPD